MYRYLSGDLMEMDVDAFFKANEKFDTYNNRIGLPFTRSLDELTGEGVIDLEKFNYPDMAKKISKLQTITTEELFDLFGVKGDARNAANFGNLKYRVTPHLKKLGFSFYKIEGKKGVFQIARFDETEQEPKTAKDKKSIPKEKSKKEQIVEILPVKKETESVAQLIDILRDDPSKISKINDLFDAQGFGLEFVITGIELRKKVISDESNVCEKDEHHC